MKYIGKKRNIWRAFGPLVYVYRRFLKDIRSHVKPNISFSILNISFLKIILHFLSNEIKVELN